MTVHATSSIDGGLGAAGHPLRDTGADELTRPRSRLLLVVATLGPALAVLVVLGLSIGAVPIPSAHVVDVLLGWTGVTIGDRATDAEHLVVTTIRMPRVLTGVLVGAALAVAGATMQALFRNPMADPGIIGVSTGGAVGAVLCLALGLQAALPAALPLLAFLGALAACAVVVRLASLGGHFSMSGLLLVGIAVSAFLGAVISATILLVPRDEQVRDILFWLAGGLDSRTWEHVTLAAVPIAAGIAAALLLARDLDLLLLGERDARTLGVRVDRTRAVVIVAAALMTGAAVAVSGVIAFVGLLVPHLMRLVVGPGHRVLLPASALGGACFLVLADTATRALLAPIEIRVGIVTALLGAPVFLVVLLRRKQQLSDAP